MPQHDPNPSEEKRADLRRAALDYHEFPVPGKIAIAPTKQLVNQHELSLAYSPGVAAPCEEIVKDPAAAFKGTARGNLIGVITNGWVAGHGLGRADRQLVGVLAEYRLDRFGFRQVAGRRRSTVGVDRAAPGPG